jgi:hypothetical protein
LTNYQPFAGILAALVLLAGCASSDPTAPLPREATSLPTVPPATEVAPTATTIATPAPDATERPRLSQSADIIAVVPDVTLNVELFYSERWMRVQQTVTLINRSPDSWDEVVFNVPINVVPEAFYLDRVTVTQGDRVQEGTPGLFGAETILRVPLPAPVSPGDSMQIDLGYRVVIPPIASTDWPPVGTTGWRFGIIQAGEWYPALVPYVAGEGWHTWEYRPVGDPTVYPLANYQLNVTTEAGITVASGGPLGQDAEGIWHFSMPAGRGIAFLASERFAVSQGEANGIPITSYYQPETSQAGEDAVTFAAQSIQLFEELYGPYPYDSLTIVENGFFGGMEYSGLISITDYAYVTYIGEPPSILHALVSHETAHQWWYGAVGNDQANEPWLDESLAFYSELLYFERYAPDSVDWWWEKRVDVYNPHGPVDATIYTYDSSASFITSMYGQAARFLHDLRDQMGDEAFFAFLQDYYRTYSGQLVTAHEFKVTAQAHTPQDLQPLFDAYFTNPNP